MTRVYIAKTRLSLSVTLPNGHRKMIAFTPLSSGGSTYVSSNKCEIEAIEKNGMFNELFSIKERDSEDFDEEITDEQGPDEEIELVTNDEVSSLADAKSFLREKGSNADLRSKVSILKEAKALGYLFPNLK